MPAGHRGASPGPTPSPPSPPTADVVRQRRRRLRRPRGHAGRPRRRAGAWRWPTRSRSSPPARSCSGRACDRRAPSSSPSTASTAPSTSACSRRRRRRPERVARIVLTASGGPFRGRTRAELADVTVDDALAHPTWSMGPKITVDSSTLMNKGLEVIEAHELFGVDYDRIEVVVHPQSIVHSMVEFTDGATIAQLSLPDMRLPHRLRPGLPRPHRHAVRAHRLGRARPPRLRAARPRGLPVPRPRLRGRAGWARPPRPGSTPPTRWRWRPSSTAASAGSRSPTSSKAVLARHDGGEPPTASTPSSTPTAGPATPPAGRHRTERTRVTDHRAADRATERAAGARRRRGPTAERASGSAARWCVGADRRCSPPGSASGAAGGDRRPRSS